MPKRPSSDEDEEEDEDEPGFASTVRCGLRPTLKDPAVWEDRIESAVHRASKIGYFTTLLIQTHLTRVCAEGRPVPRIDQSFVHRATAIVCGRSLPPRFSTHLFRGRRLRVLREGSGDTGVVEVPVPVATAVGQEIRVKSVFGSLEVGTSGPLQWIRGGQKGKRTVTAVGADTVVTLDDGSAFRNPVERVPVRLLNGWAGCDQGAVVWSATPDELRFEGGGRCSNPPKFPEAADLLQTFHEYLWDDLRDHLPNDEGLRHVREQLAKEMVVRFKQFGKDALKCHQQSYFRALFGLTPDHAKWFASRVRDLSDDPVVVPDGFRSDWLRDYGQHFRSLEDMVDQVEFHREEYNRICRTVEGSDFRTDEGKVRYRYEMLRDIDRLDPDCQKLRRFHLFPMQRVRRQFMPLTNTIIGELAGTLDRKGTTDTLTTVFDTHKLTNTKWKRPPAKRGGLECGETGGMFRTDGVQLQVVRTLRNRPTEDPNKRQRADHDDLLDPKNWVGIDPGHSNMITAAYWSEDGMYKHYGVSLKQWKVETRANFQTVRIKRRLERPSGKAVQKIESEWGTVETTDLGRLRGACALRARHYQQVYAFHSGKTLAELRFFVARHQQGFMDKMARRLVDLDRPIAFGDGSDGRSPRGKSGGPVKKFMRHLKAKGGRVWEVDEHLTSQRCHRCRCFSAPFVTTNEPWWLKNQREKAIKKTGQYVAPASHFSIHGLLVCQKCSKASDGGAISRTFNRDVNAALNMTEAGPSAAGLAPWPQYLARKPR